MRRTDRLVDLVIDSLVSLRPGQPRRRGRDDGPQRSGRPPAARAAAVRLRGDDLSGRYAVRRGGAPHRAAGRQPRISRVGGRDASRSRVGLRCTTGTRGLAVVEHRTAGERGADVPERTMALTLFRSTRRTVFTDGEPNGQLIGDLNFRYWIAPLTGAPDRAQFVPVGAAVGGRTARRYSCGARTWRCIAANRR